MNFPMDLLSTSALEKQYIDVCSRVLFSGFLISRRQKIFNMTGMRFGACS